jgi:hypothetical protein
VVVVLDCCAQGRHVAELEQVARLQRMTLQGERLVAALLGKFDHLARDGEAFFGVRCPPDRDVAVIEHRRQRCRVGQSPRHVHGLVAELGSAVEGGSELQRLGQSGQHPGPGCAVRLGQRRQGFLQETHLEVIDQTGDELHTEPERGLGQRLCCSGASRRRGRLLVGLARGRGTGLPHHGT